MHNLKSNFWKFFIYLLTVRRNYITILSIYFLTLPNTTLNMIGLYTGIGNLVGFLLEIPSGYIADLFGHKKTLILSKFCMLFSTLCFIFVQNFYGFVFGSIFLSVSFAFNSGTASAFFHETLEGLGREKEFSKLYGRMRGNVSLVSMFLIILLPFFTKIDILLPLIISLFFDIIGLIISFTLVSPKTKYEISVIEKISFSRIFNDSRKLNFLPFVIFSSAIVGFMIGASAFRSVYLESLGYPIIFLGFVMGLSRLVWFIVARYAYLIEEHFTMKQHLFFELLLFPLYFLLIAYFSNFYVVAGLSILFVGYMWGRTQVFQSYTLNHYLTHKNFKATLISIQGQVTLFFQFIIPFSIGFVMSKSFKLGYVTLAFFMFVILLVSYLLIDVKEKNL